MFDDRDLEKLYKQVGLQRDYTVGDIVVVEINPGNFWIGEVWADSIDSGFVRVKYGIYGSGDARNCMKKEFIRPATHEEIKSYQERKEQKGR